MRQVERRPGRPIVEQHLQSIQTNPATNMTVVFTHGRGAFQLAR